MIKNVVFDPVKCAIRQEAMKYAYNEIADYSAKILLKTVIKTTLIEMGTNTTISIMQNVVYRGLKREVDVVMRKDDSAGMSYPSGMPSYLRELVARRAK